MLAVQTDLNASSLAKKGWLVVLAGLGINLTLGVLYAWSVIAKDLTAPVAEGGWGWTGGEASFPYAAAVGMFALTMVFAGRAQDKLGPRIVAMTGGALMGLGVFIAGFGSPENSLPIVVGFGLKGTNVFHHTFSGSIRIIVLTKKIATSSIAEHVPVLTLHQG